MMPKRYLPVAGKASRWLCFQDARLFPHYKVRGNLRYGMAKSMVNQFDKLVALLGVNRCLIVYRAACPEAKNSAWRLVGLC